MAQVVLTNKFSSFNTMMKKIVLVVLVQVLVVVAVQAQLKRFNIDLDKFCKSTIAEFKGIPGERQAVLEDMARQMTEKKFILFTCHTNSRRTILLQVWAQTAFYYYGLIDKLSFSVGDTVTAIYPGVANVLSRSGFYCATGGNTETFGYIISVSKEYPENLLLSKKTLGTIDTTKGVIVNICEGGEQSGIAAAIGHTSLPYQSPTRFENTLQEKARYMQLNRKIAVEMLYLAYKVRELIVNGTAE